MTVDSSDVGDSNDMGQSEVASPSDAVSSHIEITDGPAEDKEDYEGEEDKEELENGRLSDSQKRTRELQEIAIEAPQNFDREEYILVPGENRVLKVLEEEEDEEGDELEYTVRFGDTREDKVSSTSDRCYSTVHLQSFCLDLMACVTLYKPSFLLCSSFVNLLCSSDITVGVLPTKHYPPRLLVLATPA